jgi:drug/metabolite transporter (DMT)-like permease
MFVSAMGALGFTTFNALYYVAAHSTTAVNIGIIQGSVPMFVLAGALAIDRTPVAGVEIAAVLVTMLGVVIVACGGELARLATFRLNFGDLLMIAACALYAGYTLALRRRPPVSALGLFTVMAGAAFLASLPLVLTEAALGRFRWPTPTGGVILALVTLFPSFLAQIFFIQGVALIGPSRAGVFVNLVPVFATIMALLVLKEPFEPFHAIALCLVLGGIWLSEHGKATSWRGPRRRRAPSARVELFGEPGLDQRLIGNVALVGGHLDPLEQAHRQAKRDRGRRGSEVR